MTTTQITTHIVGELCNQCACLIAYGDETGMDPQQVATAEATAAAIRRDGGGDLIVEPAAEDADSHYLRCALCGDDAISGGHRLIVLTER